VPHSTTVPTPSTSSGHTTEKNIGLPKVCRSKNKTKFLRRQWSEETMQNALRDFENGASQRKLCSKYVVPRSTLQKLLKGKTHIGAKPGPKPAFGDLESKLVDNATNRAALGIGFGKRQILEYGFS